MASLPVMPYALDRSSPQTTIHAPYVSITLKPHPTFSSTVSLLGYYGSALVNGGVFTGLPRLIALFGTPPGLLLLAVNTQSALG
ncbi:hypothetical protein Tsubulata_021032 [Turnera subulata]|uniref:Uncharacterized protein n=1 Tax=Turnera subulata TaxID=218843 RepID=A0A9Q0FWR3_9ROSI|nr:hypothetical protein Tsubulata_021032 [Turnera subulata]